ncbi:GNAT family N-acetyltransferase [Methanoculleus sp. Wushi-C6]|uniref:GNAT family N-acetyltransferase n=1 Tax=Methanoculleus caldifontis TaxID=2651577 RepID=A0ABU3X302_9EURY|nr:GNAT family N-acetyltransferase [Methanoculleus sp. Wushi-C6]
MTTGLIDDRERWDTFVDESASGRLFHKWDFLKITERHTGFRFLPYGIFKGNELIGICPLFQKQMHGINLLLSPPPLQSVIPYLGFLMGRRYDTAKQSKKESMLAIITEDLESEFAALAPNYLAITQVPGFIDVRQFLGEGYETRIHFSYLIDLMPPIQEIWDGFSSNLRTKLRKVEKNGYRLEKSTDISIFYSSVAERFSDPDMNIPMINRAYFEDLFRAYPDELGLYYLYDAEGTVTGVQATQEYKVFTLWMGAPKMTAMPGNEFLQWLLLQQAKERGYRQMENVGANNENLNLFKSKFNPSLTLFLELSRQDLIGRMARWAYSTIASRAPMKRKVLAYIE